MTVLSGKDINSDMNSDIYSFVLNKSMICRYPYAYGYISEIDDVMAELVLAQEQNLEPKWTETKFFKLYHTHEYLKPTAISDGFEFKDVEDTEFLEVVQFINDNYEKIRVNEAQVKSWTEHADYDGKLWIWIIDKETKRKAALGIAEVDSELREGALEWIQVDSNFRARGLGKILVHELLNRMAASADFITVSGEVDNMSKPEDLYRACGFEGERIWYMYKNMV